MKILSSQSIDGQDGIKPIISDPFASSHKVWIPLHFRKVDGNLAASHFDIQMTRFEAKLVFARIMKSDLWEKEVLSEVSESFKSKNLAIPYDCFLCLIM